VIEYPWLLAQPVCGRLLDAGSALNNNRMLDRMLPLLDELHIVTLAPEAEASWERGVSYVYADLRALPYRDGFFDVIACISTLEHVGMDNSIYGVATPPVDDPDAEQLTALREIWRVLRPGGRLLLSVPFGAYTNHGWFATLDRQRVQGFVDALEPMTATVEVFQHQRDGWQRTAPELVADLIVPDTRAERGGPGLALAARAVACVRFERGKGGPVRR
jgi:SAM-dependent methyltransferase